MKIQVKTCLSAAFVMAVLTGCGTLGSSKPQAQAQAAQPAAQQAAAPQAGQELQVMQVDSIDSRKEVAYRCGEQNKEPLTVMYGIKDGVVAVAQVRYQDKLSPGLFRATNIEGQNLFVGEGIMWSAASANAANVDKVDGNMLTQANIETVNNQTFRVDNIITDSCVLDKAATAKLNQAAAQKR